MHNQNSGGGDITGSGGEWLLYPFSRFFFTTYFNGGDRVRENGCYIIWIVWSR